MTNKQTDGFNLSTTGNTNKNDSLSYSCTG